MNYKKEYYITGSIVFLLATVVYMLTIQPNISFWNCGELSACAYTLSIPHPPGAPLWILIGRVASLFPIGSNPAVKLNTVSALSSGVTILLLYMIIISVIQSWKGFPKEKWDAYLVFGSASVGSLSLAFSDSFWFNALNSEVYAFSTMLTAFCIWLILLWWEKADNEKSDKLLLLVAYIAGLSLGVNLLTIQVILAGGLLYFFRRYEYSRINLLIAFLAACGFLLLIYPALVLWYPAWLSGTLSLFKVQSSKIVMWIAILLIPVLIIVCYISYRYKKNTVTLCLASLLLILMGYTTYSSVLLRAKVDNLSINENSPNNMETLSIYLNNEQNSNILFWPRRYSDDPVNKRIWNNYSGNLDFLWRYQFNHMFTRYLGWQYIGRAGYTQETGIDWKKFYGIPFLIGLFGLFYLFRKNWKMGLALLSLFFLMGILIALFQNYQDPQPRERDYLFLGAYLVYSIWIGIGVMGLLELTMNRIKNKSLIKTTGAIILLVSFIFIPVNMLRINYQYHNRHNTYAASDFAYNILQSTAKDAILFTDGDNDTFPLWYLQSLGYRTDVRVVNLNLLNTSWYTKQLKNDTSYGSSKLPISLNTEQINNLSPISWSDFKTVSVSVPQEAFPDSLKDNSDLPDKLTWKIPSTVTYHDTKGIRVQDVIVYDIIKTNNWQKPIYFSTSVSEDNYIGLDEYLVTEGLTKKLVPFKEESNKQFRINEQLTYNNLLSTPITYSKTPQSGYMFRGLNDPSVFFDQTELNYIQSYRSQYLTLAYSYLDRDTLKVAEVLNRMETNIPRKIIPIDYRVLYDIAMLYHNIGDRNAFSQMFTEIEKPALNELNINPDDYTSYYNPYKILIDIYEAHRDYEKALDILTKLDDIAKGSPEIRLKMDALRAKIQAEVN
jgi:hypothetical protein